MPAKDDRNPEIWVDQYGDFLYRFAFARLRDPAVAEDLVQETFLAALKGRSNFKHQSAVKTWLTAILKHNLIDCIRKKHREQTVEDIETVAASVDAHYRKGGQWKIRPGRWKLNPMKAYEQRGFIYFSNALRSFRKHLLILRQFSRSQGLWDVSVNPSVSLPTQARERIKNTLSAYRSSMNGHRRFHCDPPDVSLILFVRKPHGLETPHDMRCFFGHPTSLDAV